MVNPAVETVLDCETWRRLGNEFNLRKAGNHSVWDRSCFGSQVEDCFAKIDEIFIKTAQSVQRVIINDKHCFELYGYDILLDSELKPCVSSKIHLSALHCCCNSYYIRFALCHAGGSLKSTHLRRLLQAVKKIMTSSLGCLMTSST